MLPDAALLSAQHIRTGPASLFSQEDEQTNNLKVMLGVYNLYLIYVHALFRNNNKT